MRITTSVFIKITNVFKIAALRADESAQPCSRLGPGCLLEPTVLIPALGVLGSSFQRCLIGGGLRPCDEFAVSSSDLYAVRIGFRI